MTKTLNQIFFFPPPKSEYFFTIIGNQNIFLEKKHNPPPPPLFQVKWSFPYDVFFFTCFWVNLWTAHFYQLGALLLRKGVKCHMHSPIL